jgi:DNA primase
MWIDHRALRNQVPVERLLDLIGYHPTSRRGHRLRGACPFHAPERPLPPRCFSVELTTGLLRCSDCDAQGNQHDLCAPLRNSPLYKAALDLCDHAEVRISVINSDFAAR